MAELQEALTTYLKAYAGLTALISTRLFPDEIPQGTTLPAVFYINISDVKSHTLTGQLALESPMIQYTVYASTKPSARAVANQIKAALKDYVGTLSGVTIQYIRLINELSNKYTSPDGTIRVFTHDLEFQINYIKE